MCNEKKRVFVGYTVTKFLLSRKKKEIILLKYHHHGALHYVATFSSMLWYAHYCPYTSSHEHSHTCAPIRTQNVCMHFVIMQYIHAVNKWYLPNSNNYHINYPFLLFKGHVGLATNHSIHDKVFYFLLNALGIWIVLMGWFVLLYGRYLFYYSNILSLSPSPKYYEDIMKF